MGHTSEMGLPFEGNIGKQVLFYLLILNHELYCPKHGV